MSEEMDCVKRQVSSLITTRRALMFLAFYNLTRQRWTRISIKKRTLLFVFLNQKFVRLGIKNALFKQKTIKKSHIP